MSAAAAETLDTELFIERVFDAPRSLVFRAWTDPERLKQWCCPKGFTIAHSEGDIVAGGSFRTCMRSPDGKDHWLGGTYREIVADEKIVFTHTWLDESGTPGPETVVTVRFASAAAGTLIKLHQAPFTSQASRDGHRHGWNATFDNLTEHLKP